MTTLAIIGCGLIGGSMALSWKKAGLVDTVVGYDHHEHNLKDGLEIQALDKTAATIAEATAQADIIVVSVPVRAMNEVFREIGQNLKEGAIVTDVGSTRETVIAMARKGLGDKFKQYAPGHPIAGGEMPGIRHATGDLFYGKKLISTPTRDMNPRVVDKIEDLWAKSGALVQKMTPKQHDQIFAAVSHLPHVLAYALVDMIAREENAQSKLTMAGAGFKDFTRIAASSPVMWRDICLTNQKAISEELRNYRQRLEELQAAIDSKDAEQIEHIFENAMRNRRGLVFSGDHK